MLATTVFRRGATDRRLTALSRDVQLVDTTTTGLVVSRSFEVARGSVQTDPDIPMPGIRLLQVEQGKTTAQSFVAALGSQQTSLTPSGLVGGD